LAWLRTKRTIAGGLLAILAKNGGWMSGTESEVWAKAQPEGMVNEEGVKKVLSSITWGRIRKRMRRNDWGRMYITVTRLKPQTTPLIEGRVSKEDTTHYKIVYHDSSPDLDLRMPPPRGPQKLFVSYTRFSGSDRLDDERTRQRREQLFRHFQQHAGILDEGFYIVLTTMVYPERRDLTEYDNIVLFVVCVEHSSQSLWLTLKTGTFIQDLKSHGDVRVHAIGARLDAFSTETTRYSDLETIEGASFSYQFAPSNCEYAICTGWNEAGNKGCNSYQWVSMHNSDFERGRHRASENPITGLPGMLEKANNFKWLQSTKVRAGRTIDNTKELAEISVRLSLRNTFEIKWGSNHLEESSEDGNIDLIASAKVILTPTALTAMHFSTHMITMMSNPASMSTLPAESVSAKRCPQIPYPRDIDGQHVKTATRSILKNTDQGMARRIV